MSLRFPSLLLALASIAFFSPGANAALSATLIGSAQLWQRAEFRLADVPPANNPYDPDEIRVDATLTSPTGKTTTVPAFWFQDYTRSLVNGFQELTPAGAPEWRVRFTPTETGTYQLAVAVQLAGSAPARTASSQFAVAAATKPTHGWVQTGPDRRYFQTSDGAPLRLIGENVCWAQSNATYDYDQWFPAMAKAGENFARLWMSPWDMGLEHGQGYLNRYRQDAAWSLDYVVSLAEQNGIYFLISFDHHGMYQTSSQNWGGSNNFWNVNPYNAANGGPCAQPNDFFTDPKAKGIYQKRLRYLIARYGYSAHLLSWQFFNEIDNVFQPGQSLVGNDVVAWHREMAQWLRKNDPYRHLISTSLTGGSDRPEFWNLPELDFAVYHSYADAAPGRKAAHLAEDYHQRYQKPVMIGEFGTSARDWAIVGDPHLRGFRQGIWGGALGGSVGTDMSWWWESVHDNNVYPLYAVMHDLLRKGGWYEGAWTPISFENNDDVPTRLGEIVPNATPFTATIALSGYRRTAPRGALAVADSLSAERGAEYLTAYVQGAQGTEPQRAIRLSAHFAKAGKVSFRVNSVSGDTEMVVTVDGAEKLRTKLFDRDGQQAVNHEMDRDFSVELPEGPHAIEISSTTAHWAFVENLRLEKVRPASFADGWHHRPDVLGLRNEQGRALVYVTSPYILWPAGALRYNAPLLENQKVALTGCKPGGYSAQWFDATSGRPLGTTEANTKGGTLVLPVPAFSEDVVGLIAPQ